MKSQATTYAAMDLGSNTFRLLVAQKDSCGLAQNKQVFQHIPRLSENLQTGGNFAPEALNRAQKAILDFAEKIKVSGAKKVLAGGTMAFRLSRDGLPFMADLEKKYGWQTKILQGEEEGFYTAQGVLSGLDPLPEDSLIFDIGGRSTEFVAVKGRDIIESRSLDVGVVGLTEEFLHNDPPKASELAQLSKKVRQIISTNHFDLPRPVLVGTAGTVTTVAAVLLQLKEYKAELVNNAKISWTKISDLLKTLAAIDVQTRIKNYHLPERRADAIIAGLILVLEIMEAFKKNEIVVSDNGLLEGLWQAASTE